MHRIILYYLVLCCIMLYYGVWMVLSPRATTSILYYIPRSMLMTSSCTNLPHSDVWALLPSFVVMFEFGIWSCQVFVETIKISIWPCSLIQPPLFQFCVTGRPFNNLEQIHLGWCWRLLSFHRQVYYAQLGSESRMDGIASAVAEMTPDIAVITEQWSEQPRLGGHGVVAVKWGKTLEFTEFMTMKIKIKSLFWGTWSQTCLKLVGHGIFHSKMKYDEMTFHPYRAPKKGVGLGVFLRQILEKIRQKTSSHLVDLEKHLKNLQFFQDLFFFGNVSKPGSLNVFRFELKAQSTNAWRTEWNINQIGNLIQLMRVNINPGL